MKKITANIRWGKLVRVFGVACVFAISSASAAVVWDLNPDNLNAPVGSSSKTFTSDGYQITAYGFDNTGTPGTPHELFFKQEQEINGAIERGLGLVGTTSNELQP